MERTGHETYGIFWEFTFLDEHVGDGIFSCLYEKGAVEVSFEQRTQLMNALTNEEELIFYSTLEKITGTDGLETINLTDRAYTLGEDGTLSFDLGGLEDVEGALVEDGHFILRACTRAEIEGIKREQSYGTYT